LSAGTHTAMLGYLAADGRPLLAPVWFVVDNVELVFNTGRESAKGPALARDSRVVICVDDPHPPCSFVAGCRAAKKGPSVHDGAEDLLEIATRIGERYMGAHRAKEFGRRNSGAGELVVRVRPTKVITGLQHHRLLTAGYQLGPGAATDSRLASGAATDSVSPDCDSESGSWAARYSPSPPIVG
jgi:PPOX class probable F420-dependent enzyme